MRQVLVKQKDNIPSPPGWIGLTYSNIEGFPGVKFWVVNVENEQAFSDWKGQYNILDSDVLETGTNGNNTLIDKTGIITPENAIALTIILIGLGVLTGAGLMDLLVIAAIGLLFYAALTGIEALKNLIDKGLDFLIPDSLKKLLDDMGIGYENFKMFLELTIAVILGYYGYKKFKEIK